MPRVTRQRIAALEQRIAPQRPLAPFVIGCVEDWPDAAQREWAEAVRVGDRRRQEDLVEQHEGGRPDLSGPYVGLILLPPRVRDGV